MEKAKTKANKPLAAQLLKAERKIAKKDREKGVGRTKGATNIRSEALADRTMARHGALPGDILLATALEGLDEHLAEGKPLGDFIQSRARQIRKDLYMNQKEAVQYLTGLLKDCMPYVHQKLPMAVDVTERRVAFVAVDIEGQEAVKGGKLSLLPADVRQAQEGDVIDADPSD